MKELLTVVSLLICGALGEAPYAPSGWRPDGPAFELPQKAPPQKQEYLPPVDPRNPPSDSYGPPEVDVSVQGLPTEEPQPLFRISPINGQQYVRPAFEADVKELNERLRQSQYQAQQERYRQEARQRQLEAQGNANQPSYQVPSQFVPRTTAKPTQATTKIDESRTTQVDTTTESLNLNQGEVLDRSSEKKEKTTVEISKQNIQAFPPELFLTSLAQLNLQSQQQYAPLHLGQIRAPVYFQPAQGISQKQVAGYDGATHFAALPSVLAQQQLLQAQLVSQQQQSQVINPFVIPQQQASFVQSEQAVVPANRFEIQPLQPQIQAQPVAFQPQLNQVQTAYGQPQKPNSESDIEEVQPVQPVQSVQPQFVYQQTYPQGQQVFPQGQQSYPQTQQVYPQTQIYPQPAQYYPQTQQVYPQYPQQQFFPQSQQYQPNQYAPIQAQLTPTDYQLYQQQVYQSQNQQPQDGSLQSGLDANMQGNGVDEGKNEDEDDNEGQTVTAVATAFGARTQPRVAYGVPVPRVQANTEYQTRGETNSVYQSRGQANPEYQTREQANPEYQARGQAVPEYQTRGQNNPEYQTTTEVAKEEGSDDGASATESSAVRGSRRKSAKLRSRRLRPVFTLDRSGHLVLAQEQ